MNLRQEKSEEFRANIFLFVGYAFCTPLGLGISRYILEKIPLNIEAFFESALLFIIGSLLIVKSYSIIDDIGLSND